MEHKRKYEAEIESMPAGLDRAVLRVVSGYQAALPIGRVRMVYNVGLAGFHVSERQVREAIKGLRRQGHLICSTPGENGGYYMASTLEEYREFRKNEYAAKIADMAETMQAMDAAARAQFGDGFQLGLGV